MSPFIDYMVSRRFRQKVAEPEETLLVYDDTGSTGPADAVCWAEAGRRPFRRRGDVGGDDSAGARGGKSGHVRILFPARVEYFGDRRRCISYGPNASPPRDRPKNQTAHPARKESGDSS